MNRALADIFPVIVTYRCQCSEARSYQTLVQPGGFEAFMVYDNSPATFHTDTAALPPCAVYVRDVDNGGLSKAYNRAAAYALEQGFSRLLLLDQDTAFAPSAAEAYANGPRHVPLWAPIIHTDGGAPFSPGNVEGWRVRAVSPQPGTYSLCQLLPVNSGMCVSLKAFTAAGGYREAVRLDFADYQFLHRLRRVAPTFALLPTVAVQDFSDNVRDANALLARFRLYLDSALHCEHESCRQRAAHHLNVALHTLSLFGRTRKWAFLNLWLNKYILKK